MKAMLFMAVSCLALLSLAGISAAASSQVIDSYEGNLSEKELAPIDMLSLLGRTGFFVAETVKFEAPKPGWRIDSVQVIGWDGFNGTAESLPEERVIGLEIRDKDLNLLYKFADSQLPYSNYAYNATGLYPLTIQVPSIPVTDEFYVCFYDRGAVAVACERLNETSKNSFLYLAPGGQLLPANLPVGENETLAVNWIMSVSGS
ncbi:MAG: hypothetical protein QUS08_04040 [Methanothrix sp.]|nr:hypothetical protein [Methanothrix sp.]